MSDAAEQARDLQDAVDGRFARDLKSELLPRLALGLLRSPYEAIDHGRIDEVRLAEIDYEQIAVVQQIREQLVKLWSGCEVVLTGAPDYRHVWQRVFHGKLRR